MPVLLFYFIISGALNFSNSFAATTSINNVLIDAESSFIAGDLLHSYRSYIFLEQVKPDHFNKVALAGYLETIFILSPEAFVREECDRFALRPDSGVRAKANYICGLHFVEEKKPEVATVYLEKVERNSNFFWPAQIARATGDLILGKPDLAAQHLDIKELKSYEKAGIGDELQITLARIRVTQNKLEEALKYYQAINSSSPFYVEALEETAWIFFKLEKYESAQVLIDVLKANYESAQKSSLNLKISSATYYKARYLEAYIILVQQRTEAATGLFSELQRDYSKYPLLKRDANVGIYLNNSKMAAFLKGQDIKSSNFRNFQENVSLVMPVISDWVTPELKAQLEKEIKLETAYSFELDRTSKFKSQFNDTLTDYPALTQKLWESTLPQVLKKYALVNTKLNQGINVLSLKAELGKLEITWMARAQGTRSLDEVTDDYISKINVINELMPP